MVGRGRKNLFFTIVFIFTALFISFSCSQTLPEIVTADYSVIFEYKDMENLPASRLSVFVSSANDIHRCSSIKLLSKESGFVWETFDVVKLNEADMQWAGNVNFVAPENEIIPSGLYEVTLVNADQEEDSFEFTVTYDSKLYKCISSDAQDFMSKQNGVRKIIIYDKDGKVLFFGNRNDDLLSVRGIWNNYRDAEYFQDIWCAKDNSVMCIMPEEKVALE